MKLIKQSFEILTEKSDFARMLTDIEKAGRTCYKSEDKMTDETNVNFVKALIKSGHESVIEHRSFTVKFICDRGVSHEIVRHRLASFSQESTRYCNYSKDKFDNQLTFIIPCWTNIPETNVDDHEDLHLWLAGEFEDYTPTQEEGIWLTAMLDSELSYSWLITTACKNWQPQQARSVLPNSLKTEIVVTANLREWRTIFKQRTAKVAHPQMRELMCPLLDEMKQLLPVVFDDIDYEK